MKKISLLMLAVLSAGFFLYMIVFTGNSRTASAHTVTAAADSSGINWEKMTHKEREAYMKHVVMPKMREVFRSFDSVHFRKIHCKTCHGKGAENETFKMPNPDLPKLPNSREGWIALGKKHPKMMKFMHSEVKPTMMHLLNMKPFDMKTRTGFSCGNCHTERK